MIPPTGEISGTDERLGFFGVLRLSDLRPIFGVATNPIAMTTPIIASCYFRVIAPLYFPVRAQPGDFLGLWSLPQNLWVYDSTGSTVLRRTFFEYGKLWTLLDELLEREVILFLDASAAEQLRRPPAGEASSRPALKLLRAR